VNIQLNSLWTLHSLLACIGEGRIKDINKERLMKFYCEYICEDRKYERAAKIPEAVALVWLRNSKVFNERMLTYFMIGSAADDQTAPIRWMNKGAIRVDDGEDEFGEVWLYKHDFSYWVVVPKIGKKEMSARKLVLKRARALVGPPPKGVSVENTYPENSVLIKFNIEDTKNCEWVYEVEGALSGEFTIFISAYS